MSLSGDSGDEAEVRPTEMVRKYPALVIPDVRDLSKNSGPLFVP